MFRHSSNLVGSKMGGAVLVAIALALAGCGEEPTLPRLISFSPTELTVPAGETLALSVEYEENDFALQDFQWRADAGEIEGNGAPSITYHAPADPGDYKIAVTVGYGDNNDTLSLDSVVTVTEAVGPAAPAVAEATNSTTAPAEPTERAATETAAELGVEAAGTTASAAGEQGGTATEAAVGRTASEATAVTEEGATTIEEGSETVAAAPGQAVEEMAGATEQGTEQTGTPVVEGAEHAGRALEETAEATVAAVREGAEEAGTFTEEAAEQARSDVAAVTEEAGASDNQPPAAPASSETTQAGEQSPAKAPPAPEAQVAALAQGPAGTKASAGSRIDQILEKRRLTAVVQIAFKPFSFYDEDGRRNGFDIDMVREFARRWLDDPKAVTFLPVPTDARIPTLQKGRADIIAAALTKTPERAAAVDFSLTYFKDGQQLLVQETSAVADVCDLNGKKVAAIDGSTSLDNIKAAATKCGFELGDGLVIFRRHDDAIEALLEGQVEAFTSDGIALENFAIGHPLKVVGNHFSEEPYGFAVPKGDQRLLQLVNHTLEEMEKDGTYAALYEKWFGDAIRPYPLEESEPMAAPEVAALATTSAPALVEPKTQPAERIEQYVVQRGDTLSRIAGKVYGDVSPASWEQIFEANRDVIGDNPSRIQVGMTLTIPQ
jgi:ABC-type amino acid transport substrate-binding protein